ncbi:MAG: FHA domain-containing protein [Sterolibacterium sp.]|nr:FHA domain-containing protein [Sterolibacterium sp.]
MEKIIVSLEGMTLREIPLVNERTTIGRKAHNDIQIDNLAISGEHAVIIRQPDGIYVEDLDSTNGTQVNGLPVRKHRLQHGDAINLGRYRLTYLAPAPLTANAARATSTAAPTAPALPLAVVQVLSGAHAGKEMLLDKALCTLGKPGIQVAAIARRAQGYFLTPLEGAALPTINGQPLEGQAHLLHEHDIIELAGVKMEFFFKR